MTQETQKRIEQIRQGEVPEGYKKTKTGIVPIDWTTLTMNDIYTERKEAGDPSLPVLSVSIHSGVSDGELDEAELGKKVKRIEDKTKYLTARKGDLVFNMMRAWQGAVGVVRTDGLVSPAYIVANPNGKLYPAFMNEYMMLPSTINRLHKQSYGVTDFRLRLYWDSFAKIDCCLPSLPEQEKIAKVLGTQDRVIALCEKKVDELKRLKKVFLQKMFPKPGATVPEWRFPGFTDAWEQHKLSKIADKVTEKNTDFAVQETFTNSAELGVVSQRDFFDHDISNAENIGGYYVVRNEDFVYNPRISVTAPVGPINRNKLGRNGVMSPLYTVFRTHDIDTTYLEWFFKSNYWHSFMFFNGDSGARSDRFSIKDAVFFEMPIPAPSLAEQRQIGAYMDKLENLITLHQRKCDEEKQKKKTLMQLLLTGIVRVNK